MHKVIYGGGVLIVGDLHFSDVYEGKHKNYLKNCFYCLGEIMKRVKSGKYSVLVILGDIVGLKERNVKNREVLAMLCKFFKEVNQHCKVFCVRGNHDVSDYPEFQFLAELEMFETSGSTDGYFDYYGYEGQEHPEIRFHMMDYGAEGRRIELAPEPASNVVLAHNNFTIQGQTNWYNQHDGIELSMMQNLTGVNMLISGHIHNPSPSLIATRMVTGGDCMLFYPGCPTRPSLEHNMYESVWFVTFGYNTTTHETDYDAEPFLLEPLADVFYLDDNYVEEKTEAELQELERKEALHDVLNDILKCRMTSGDLVNQIRVVPNATDAAKDIACRYLQMALDSRI